VIERNGVAEANHGHSTTFVRYIIYAHDTLFDQGFGHGPDGVSLAFGRLGF
jgi:hypothetical protein